MLVWKYAFLVTYFPTVWRKDYHAYQINAKTFCSHGSGGLAGQYRFGARSEVSIVLLGACKLLLGILFGSSLVGLLQLFPDSILAVMLFISAIELASAARVLNQNEPDLVKQKENYLVMLITMGTIFAFSNDGIGFLCGMGAAILLAIQRLGLRQWCVDVWNGFRALPSVWLDPHAHYMKRETSNSSSSTSEGVRESASVYENAGLPKPATAPNTSH